MITVRADSSCIFLSDITSLKGYVEWVRENQASVILNNQRFLLSLRPCSKEYRVVDVREGWSPFLDAFACLVLPKEKLPVTRAMFEKRVKSA